MPDCKIRQFEIDDDVLEVQYQYDAAVARWYGNYPVFAETPRHTPNGRPWKNVFNTDCSYSDSEFGDCGGCSFFRRQHPKDVIAVCFKDEMKQEPASEVCCE